MKTCTKCKTEYPATREYFYKQKDGKFELHSHCKKCFLKKQKQYYQQNRKKLLQQKKKYSQTEKGKAAYRRAGKKYYAKNYRKRHLKKHYNMTLREYFELFENQNGCCAICNTPQFELSKILFVDHNHVTGKIRGLLCCKCNTGLGWYEGNVEYMLNYMEKYNEPSIA